MNAAHVGQKVCHPVVIIKVNGVICCALLDPGVTGSYISAFLLNLLKVKPPRTLTRGFKTIMGLVIKHVETYMYNVKMYASLSFTWPSPSPQQMYWPIYLFGSVGN